MTDESTSTPASTSNPEPNPVIDLTQEQLEAILRRAIWRTLLLGLGAVLVLWKASGWRNAAMMATGAAISAVSIQEWRRLTRFLSNRMVRDLMALPQEAAAGGEDADSGRKARPRGGFLAAVFFVLRLTVFAGAIYGSLRCFHGSSVALLCGLSLAVLAMLWEAIRLLRD